MKFFKIGFACILIQLITLTISYMICGATIPTITRLILIIFTAGFYASMIAMIWSKK